jgi:hypothetical protein
MAALKQRGEDQSGEREQSKSTVHKCAYELCACAVESGVKYCCLYCQDAAREKEIELQCDCKHALCAL